MRYILDVIIVLFILGVGIAAFIYIPKFKKPKKPHPSTKSHALIGDTEQLATIFGSIEDGLVLIDAKGIIRLFNTAAGIITSWKPEDAVGIDVDVVVKLGDGMGNLLAGSTYPFNKVLTSGESIRDKTELITADSKGIAVGLTITPLKDDDGKVTGAVALMRNITQEKEQEGRLGDFISTASHEMRTPVAAIEGYLALSLNNKVATVDDVARGYLEKAQEATKHLGTLFQDLLTSAKAEDGRLVSHPVVVELGELLKSLGEDLKFVAEKHNLETDFIVGSSSVQTALTQQVGERQVTPLYYAYIDPDRLREVISNLYDNAVKYTPEGKITIGITGDDQVVQFYVRDTGTGIPSEDVPHLFQKFYRVDNSATRTIGGNGLGLFICRKIIELYNGRIWVESEVGKGSTFYINVPRLTDQKAKELMKDKGNPANISPTTTNTPAAA
jgi:PAS domain S-box-containing protein